jgi:hypothetical protein
MTGPRAVQRDKSILHNWFGPNRNTHWTIAGSVVVILLGTYLIYSNRDITPAAVVVISPPVPSAVPTNAVPPAPLKSEE